jgi:AcrR family transcriptional regulator
MIYAASVPGSLKPVKIQSTAMCPESSTPDARPYKLRKRAQSMAATRERITEAAVDLHGSVGPARTTITAVADLAGVQRHTVYRHFPTEDDLFAACSGHFFAAHRWPDPASWEPIADPEQRLVNALDEVYAYFEGTEAMFTNVLRDAPLVASVGPALTPFYAFLDEAGRVLAAGWPARGRRRRLVSAATRHAVDFGTWRSLVRDGGVTRAHAVELAAAMVRQAGHPG